MVKRMHTLMLSILLCGLWSSTGQAMRRTPSQAARIAGRLARPAIASRVAPIASKITFSATPRFNTGIVNPECRLKEPSAGQRSIRSKLSLPSLQQRWQSTSARVFSDDASGVEKAINAYNEQNEHAYSIALSSIADRPDLLKEVYTLTGDSRVEELILKQNGVSSAQSKVPLVGLAREQKIEDALEKAKDALEISALKSVSFDIETKPGFSLDKAQKRKYKKAAYIAEHISFDRRSFDLGGFRNLIKEFVETLRSDGVDTVESFIILRDEDLLNFDRIKRLLSEKLRKDVASFLSRNNILSEADPQIIDASRAINEISDTVVVLMDGKIIQEAVHVYDQSLIKFGEELRKLRGRYTKSEGTMRKGSQKTLKQPGKTHGAAPEKYEFGSQKRFMSTNRKNDPIERVIMQASADYKYNRAAYNRTVELFTGTKNLEVLRRIYKSTEDRELKKYLDLQPQHDVPEEKKSRYKKEDLSDYYHKTAGSYDYGDDEFERSLEEQRRRKEASDKKEEQRKEAAFEKKHIQSDTKSVAPEKKHKPVDKKNPEIRAQLETFNADLRKRASEFGLLQFTPSDTNDRFPQPTFMQWLTGYDSYYERIVLFMVTELEDAARDGKLFDVKNMQDALESECRTVIKNLEKDGLDYTSAVADLRAGIDWKKINDDFMLVLQKKIMEYIALNRLSPASYITMKAGYLSQKITDRLRESGGANGVAEKYNELYSKALDTVLNKLREESHHFKIFKSMDSGS